MADQKAVRGIWFWGAGIVIMAVIGTALMVINQPRATIPVSGVSVTPTTIASSKNTAIEHYSALVLEAQKTFFVANKQYASQLNQLKIALPTAGIKVDYRGSSPLGFCWLVRTEGDVWYTVSQQRVNRTTQVVSGPPPISCQ